MRIMLVLPLLLVACGQSSSDSSESGLEIPEGVYKFGATVRQGKTYPNTGSATIDVRHSGSLTTFRITGSIEDGYTCDPRVWQARIDDSGDAHDVERTQENCTVSLSKAAYEALKRNYRMSGKDFIERIQDTDTQIEVTYLKW